MQVILGVDKITDLYIKAAAITVLQYYTVLSKAYIVSSFNSLHIYFTNECMHGAVCVLYQAH